MKLKNHENKNRISFIPLIVLGLVVILTSNCKKDDNTNPTTIADIDGNVYKTVPIGTQLWMAEDLKTTKFNDNLNIPLVNDNMTWRNLTTPGYCFYGSDISAYGGIYNFYAVSTGKLCPKGWHVPSDDEWTSLTNYLGGDSIAGGKMKEAGTSHWESPNEGATNESGFTALPGHYRNVYGSYFDYNGEIVFWWSSSISDTITAFSRVITVSSNSIERMYHQKEYGFNVRCLRN
jgi:uncharacterized protein (TIGR02145 family)